jgi:hypothetical protein
VIGRLEGKQNIDLLQQLVNRECELCTGNSGINTRILPPAGRPLIEMHGSENGQPICHFFFYSSVVFAMSD